MTIPALTLHVRYAVHSPKGWILKNTGNDWKTKLPGYSHTDDVRHAFLFKQKGGATKAANIVGGTVVPMRIEALG